MFASQRRQTLDLPGQPGHTVTIRGLSWTKLQRAQTALVVWGVATYGHEHYAKALREHGEQAIRVEAAARGPHYGYDWQTLIELAVVEWTPPRPTPARRDPLEKWLARAIVEFSTRQGR